MRAVLDPNVIVPALLSRRGAPAIVLRAWLDGAYELAVSPHLLDELERVLRYPKIASRVTPAEAGALVDLLRGQAELIDDPGTPPALGSSDPDDDYLISLAEAVRAVIVSGDRHLLDLADRIPVFTARSFLTMMDSPDG